MSVHKHNSTRQSSLKARRATATGNQVEYRDEEKGKDSYKSFIFVSLFYIYCTRVGMHLLMQRRLKGM